MINLNSKEWNQLTVGDIENVVQNEEESFYFEFKDDRVESKKLAEEISAFANTYGGYIFLGISDNKNIIGCDKWNEQRIHTMIHDSLSPIPDFDVKKFVTSDGKIVFVIKIEEGIEPPYITSRGKIYERLSSGSFEIKDSVKLTQMYYKRESEYKRIEDKLAISELKIEDDNLFGYLDIGFSVKLTNRDEIWNKYINADLKEIASGIHDNIYSIARVGSSLVISVGEIKNPKGVVTADLHNFMEIMVDGSVKMRILLTNNNGQSEINIATITGTLSIFKDIYYKIFGESYETIFIGAYKYEKLTVLKQFTTIFRYDGEKNNEINNEWKEILNNHIRNYGNNLIISSDRFPKYGLKTMDRRYFDRISIDFKSVDIIEALFRSMYSFLGYIDIMSED